MEYSVSEKYVMCAIYHMANNKKWNDQDLRLAVENSESIRAVLNKLGLRAAGGNYATIKARIASLGIDNTHFTGQGWCKGDKHESLTAKHHRMSLDVILVKNSTYQCTDRLKKRLIANNMLVNECAICGLGPLWNDKPLSLQLDHKDGDRCNNELDNLRLLCPNCHSQTDNFAGKAKKKPR